MLVAIEKEGNPFILIIVLTIVVSLALIIGISLGIGWILTLLFPCLRELYWA